MSCRCATALRMLPHLASPCWASSAVIQRRDSRRASCPYALLLPRALPLRRRLTFVMGTVGAQLEAKFGHKHKGAQRSARLAGTFSALLPFGFLGMPLIGWLLDRKPLCASFFLVDLAGAAYGALLFAQADWALELCFALVALSQQLVYSTYFAAVAKLFGFANYGKLSGVINLLVAGLGSAQYALGALALAHGFAAVNLALLVSVLPLLAYSLSRLAASCCCTPRASSLAGPGEPDLPAVLRLTLSA